jgi:hypothetical protein
MLKGREYYQLERSSLLGKKKGVWQSAQKLNKKPPEPND